MLLGSIAFVLSLFYAVNHPDEDMVRYSWQAIDGTIAVFSAILLFKACDAIVDHFAPQNDEVVKMLFDFGQMVFWLVLLQAALFSSAVFERSHHSEVCHGTSPLCHPGLQLRGQYVPFNENEGAYTQSSRLCVSG